MRALLIAVAALLLAILVVLVLAWSGVRSPFRADEAAPREPLCAVWEDPAIDNCRPRRRYGF